MANIRLSIIFLNYNRLDETRLTTERLLCLCGERHEIEIIAIDNGSTDGTAEFLRAQPRLHTILLPDNRGIAGYNEGFAQAQGEVLLVLDDDSCPEKAELFDRGLAYFDALPQLGILACAIVARDGRLQYSWHLPASGRAGPSPFFIGCGFFIRRELMQVLGGYPGQFFLYQNEVDLSFRVRQAGYQIVFDPDCRVVHRGEPSQRPGWRRVFYPTRNTLWLIRAYYPQPLAAYMLLSRLLIGWVRAVQFRQFRAFWRGLREGLSYPVEKHFLTAALREEFAPFWRQNSLIHQIFRCS